MVNYYILSQILFPIFIVLLTLGYLLSAKVNSYEEDKLNGPLGNLTKKVGLKFATFTFYSFDLLVSIILFIAAASNWWYVVLLVVEIVIYSLVCYKSNSRLKALSKLKTS